MEHDLQTHTAPKLRSGWRVAFEALRVRLRFLLAIGLLAVLAGLWPWLTNASERLVAWFWMRSTDSAVAADTEYFCPMDPGVVSAWPAICPICKMDLITRKKSDATILPSGVVARMQLSPYRISLSGVRTLPVEASPAAVEGEPAVLRVPASAVVRRGEETLVYVESMPGMLDGVLVELGDRDGDFYRVGQGLSAGQRVVALGTLLVDAESRLNPHLSTQYFGASLQTAAASEPAPEVRLAGKEAAAAGLSAADQDRVARQRYCPVTQLELGSMGKPIFVDVQDRKIAICCAVVGDACWPTPRSTSRGWTKSWPANQKPSSARVCSCSSYWR